MIYVNVLFTKLPITNLHDVDYNLFNTLVNMH